MSIVTEIVDGSGRGNKLKINGEGELAVTVHTHPPRDEGIESLPFRTYFLNGVSNDMRVDGSSTPVEFSIEADSDYDYFIKSLSVKLSDPSAKLDKFGNLSALTNGVEFIWTSQDVGELVIHDGIKDNLEFFRLSKQKAEIIDLSGGGADAIVVTIDLAEMFGNPWGVRLTKNTTDRLFWRVNDNLGTGIVEFNIIGYGIKI
jgi:hypothetical protein